MGAAVVVFVCIASIGYRVIEDEYTWLDAIYMTIISLSTVGYAEVGELTHSGRLWTLGVIVMGMVTAGVFLTMLVGAIIEGRFQRLFGRRQMERKIASLTNHVIVCGYGRMGAEVAQELAA
ncbi:MAG: ion channel, partial [Planctomycetota bacterium]